MKKLNITKEAFSKSKYFTKKYGSLKYVSESGKLFKTSKGNVLKFTESSEVQCDGCGEMVHDDTVEIVGDQVLCDKCRGGVQYYEDMDDEENASMNESHNDLDNDPAYECPYCGGHNCEFNDAEDYPEEGYFDGSTLKTCFHCLDCEEYYQVEFGLNVKGVKSMKVQNRKGGRFR